jgi:glycosyltransferase involved in cell wall biosynthesis
MTIHLIYPHENRISAPDVIGFVLSKALSSLGSVKTYDWDSICKIDPDPGDILIGHPHPFPYTVFRRSIMNKGWSRKIILQPFNLDVNQVGYIDSFIDQCDLFFAITGNYWFSRIEHSCLSRWLPKMVHIDLAVDRKSFPKIKNTYNLPGQRQFIYIGNDHPAKNISFLSNIAQALPEYNFAWAGKGKQQKGLLRLGYLDFSLECSRRIISQYDFMVTVGTADANPTTVLESMSWGLIPVCTPTSGYENMPGIVNLPSDDIEGAVSVIRQLQNCPEIELRSLSNSAERMIETHFNWDRFCSQVIEKLKSEESPELIKHPSVNSIDWLNGYERFGQVILGNIKQWMKANYG